MINYSKLKNKNSGQIGIFVVLAIILIILFIFLISMKSSDQIDDIEKSNTEIEQYQGELFPFKTSIDNCLETQLKNALIIAGLRGGLIYQDGEKYIQSNGVDSYDTNFLRNFDLNLNYLQKNLLHSQFTVFTPLYDGTTPIYTHSIQEDFQRYILFNLNTCLSLERLNTQDFEITQNIFFGTLINIDVGTKEIELTKIDGVRGDTIALSIDGKLYYGFISQDNTNLDLNTYAELYDFPTVSNTLIQDTVVINLNNSVELEIIFEDDKVSTKLTYPIIIKKNEQKIYFKGTNIVVENRFKRILELGKYLLLQKTYNRTINFEESSDLDALLIFPPFNKLEDLEYEITINNDELDYKLKTLSIIDNKYKIFSNPFVFNFGYENTAPVLTLTSIGDYDGAIPLNLESNYFKLNKNKLYTFNLRDFLYDKQYLDNGFSIFSEISDPTSEYNFKLEQSGELSFIAKQEGVYSFQVKVTDLETSNLYEFTFDAGLSSGFRPEDLENFVFINLDSYTDGQMDFTFTKAFEVFDGSISHLPNLINIKMNKEDLIAQTNTIPTHLQGLEIEGTYSNESFFIQPLGSKTAAAIYRDMVNLLFFSDSIQAQLFNDRTIPKTQESILSLTLVSTTLNNNNLEVNFSNSLVTSNKVQHDIAFKYPSNLNPGTFLETKFYYENNVPTLDSGTSSQSFSFNMAIESVPFHTISTATDIDLDILYFNTSLPVDSPISFSVSSSSGQVYFSPRDRGTYSFQAWASDGELITAKSTLSYNVRNEYDFSFNKNTTPTYTSSVRSFSGYSFTSSAGLSMSSDGSFSFTPSSSGTHTFNAWQSNGVETINRMTINFEVTE